MTRQRTIYEEQHCYWGFFVALLVVAGPSHALWLAWFAANHVLQANIEAARMGREVTWFPTRSD